MRSFVLLGSMLQSSSLVKADCTLQDGTVQIGARKLSEFSRKTSPYTKTYPKTNQKSMIFIHIYPQINLKFTPTSNFHPDWYPKFHSQALLSSMRHRLWSETISSFLG